MVQTSADSSDRETVANPTARRSGGRRSSTALQRLRVSLRWSAGLAALLAALVLIANFPPGNTSLLPILGLYAAICLIWRYGWLLLLPSLLLTYDLTPWSGRAGLNELDLLLLITLSTGWFRPPPMPSAAPSAVANRGLLLLWGLYLALISSAAFNQGGFELGALSGLIYYAPDFSLLQTRGMLYALLLSSLWYPLYRHDPEKAARNLLLGGSLAALALAVVILWERGVFADLFSAGPYYQRLRSLLDFSTTYRVTGVLSEMHTGGEAIDGLLMTVIPISLVAVFGSSGWRQWLAVSAFLGASYALFSTFTRTTYASYGLGLLLFAVLVMLRNRALLATLSATEAWLLAANGAALLLLGVIYALSGYMGLLAGSLMLVFGFCCSALPRAWRRWWLLMPIYGLLAGLGLYGQLTSKWVSASAVDVTLLVAVLAFTGLSAGMFSLRFQLRPGPLLFVGSMLVLLAALIASVLGGNRMADRITTIDTDFGTRFSHWRNVLGAMDRGGDTLLLGMGKGSFPRAYALAYQDEVRSAGGLRIMDSGEQRYLRFGQGSDLSLAQRLEVHPGQDYRISFRVRNTENGSLSIGFCERNIIYASDFGVNCADRWLGLSPTAGEWVKHTIEINTQGLGAQPIWYRWPRVLYLKSGSIIDIDDIELRTGDQRFELLNNGNFSEGMDYWYTYNDFKHLPWHIKNLPLALFFEGGLLGLLVTGGLIAVALKRGFTLARAGNRVATAAWLAIMGVLVVGAMGNPLDSVRASLLFYLLVMILAGTDFREQDA